MLKPILLISLILGVIVATNPAAQSGRPSATPSSNEPALTALDYIEIEQLVYRYGWALDSGENNGYVYADLYAPDGTFTGTNQAPSGRTYQGRDNLAALARGGRRGPFYISHLVTNVVITPTCRGSCRKGVQLGFSISVNQAAIAVGGTRRFLRRCVCENQ